ncbi:MAG TPA: hypothetical protein PKC18_01710 [Lacipirellulaceae bacterium]|nr:hypothetical protein [Lacipirellulaceae bacterium]
MAHAAIVVAAHNSTPQEKARADFVCDGNDDQVELAASLALARRSETSFDVDPGSQRSIECAVDHAVEWLPGTYNLSDSLEIPNAANCSIRAEGTTMHFTKASGDAVVIRGANRCRYVFGAIFSKSDGAALLIQPTGDMPTLMTFVEFSGLVGHEQRGVGLRLDPAHENICVNRFVGTDISGFDSGVVVGDAGGRSGASSTHGKCDTNWFWLSYVRMCRTCIAEGSKGVDCSVWEVNVDASIPESVAIRAGGAYGRWFVIMGAYGHERTNLALIIEPGARHCVFDLQPPIDEFVWEDRSGNDTNAVRRLAVRPPQP